MKAPGPFHPWLKCGFFVMHKYLQQLAEIIDDITCSGKDQRLAIHKDKTKECPSQLDAAWSHWQDGKWIEAGQKMVVKCVDISKINPADLMKIMGGK